MCLGCAVASGTPSCWLQLCLSTSSHFALLLRCLFLVQVFVPQAALISMLLPVCVSLGLTATDCSGYDYGSVSFTVDASKSLQSCSGPALVTAANVSCLVTCGCNYYQAISHQQCTNCEACPPGGQCSADSILAVAGQWGAPDPATGVVSFGVCPTEYCCGGPAWPCTKRNSCAGNRTGQLCGDCTKGFVVPIGSEYCVSVDSCSSSLGPVAGVGVVVFIAGALVQLIPVSGVWLPSTTFPSGKARLAIYFAQVVVWYVVYLSALSCATPPLPPSRMSCGACVVVRPGYRPTVSAHSTLLFALPSSCLLLRRQ